MDCVSLELAIMMVWCRIVDMIKALSEYHADSTIGQQNDRAALAPTWRRFELILVRPSHYDDGEYVTQWLRSFMPSNALLSLYGLATDSGRAGRTRPGC